MKLKLPFIIVMILIQNQAQAAGGVSDLLYPAINFVIFASLMSWLIIPFAKRYFISEHDERIKVRQNVEAKKAQAMKELAEQERERANLQTRLIDIRKEASDFIEKYKQSNQSELNEKLNKMDQDFKLQLQREEQAAIEGLKKELLHNVVLKTKSSVAQNSDLKTQVEQNLSRGF